MSKQHIPFWSVKSEQLKVVETFVKGRDINFAVVMGVCLPIVFDTLLGTGEEDGSIEVGCLGACDVL